LNEPNFCKSEPMKKNLSIVLLLVATISIFYVSCKKDDSSDNGDNTPVVTERQRIINEYNAGYLGTNVSDPLWTGNTSTCDAGTISADAVSKTLQRINYFRKMAGVSYNIKFDAVRNGKCQEAALMMHANYTLDHNPPTTWSCYTNNGAEAAGHSNLASGTTSYAINMYMSDYGTGNEACGHRRWLLYSRADTMGLGSTSGYQALWVIGGTVTPATMPDHIAWPPQGYVPAPLVFSRWSLGVPGGDFSSASVNMTDASGTAVPLSIISTTSGYGDNTIVWLPTGIITNSTADVTYHVTVGNVNVGGNIKSYDYNVVIIQPS
jgi:hypothetical protein